MRISSSLTVMTIVVGGLLLATPTLAGGGGGAACHATSSGRQLTMLDSCFDGIAHEVPAGTTLTVTNRGEMSHTITAVDGSFDSGSLAPGHTFQIQLDRAGDMPVYCTLHGTAEGQGMAGVLQVSGPLNPDLASTTPTNGSSFPATEAVAALVGVGMGAFVQRRRDRRNSRAPQQDGSGSRPAADG